MSAYLIAIIYIISSTVMCSRGVERIRIEGSAGQPGGGEGPGAAVHSAQRPL